MAKNRRVTQALLFCLALLFLIPVCLVLWGFVLPAYAHVLGKATLPLLRVVSGAPIESVAVKPEGMYNTGTFLEYTIDGNHPRLGVGALVFNVPPFIALMAITPGLRWKRRLWALLLGTAILAVGHVLFITLAFVYAPQIAHSPEIPTALGELFLTLPFLLWIVLGYWEKLTALLTPPAPPQAQSPPPAQN